MQPLTDHINSTVDRIDATLDGWTQGRLVIDQGNAYIEVEPFQFVPVPAGVTVEVKNGSIWQRLTEADLQAVTVDGWPAYAGLPARIQEDPSTCETCANRGWETSDAVAACNCCEDHEFYTREEESR